MDLIKFILITYGISLAISAARPLKPLREFITRKSLIIGEWINCVKCLSIWIAIPIYYFIYKQFSIETIAYCFIAFAVVSILENIKTCK